MQLHRYLSALATALPLFASAAVAQLAPWQVSNIQTWSPSGRPGSSPYYYIHVNITNPDPTQTATDPGITQGQVYCDISWLYPDAPYNNISACEIVNTTAPSAWAWTVELLEADTDPSSTTNFELRWRAAANPEASTDSSTEIWTGVGKFQVGDNLQGTCAGSGFCSWYLKPTNTPFPINVTSVQCQGTAEEALNDMDCY
ncbi:hypothetical protein GGR51DRAFT_531740 [Nemania sp. FL0031]|nr:hypothetical protein GGR51DRAFT_531740 [Nemania sp. FL0031]